MKVIKLLLLLTLFFYTIIPSALSASDKPTIAVLRFENKSPFDRLDPFEVALPYMLISDLSKISGIQLVERDKIDKLMAETGLAEKDLMDPATMQKAGKALGADIIITGTFCEEIESGKTVEESNLSITLNIENVATGKVIKKIQVKGKSKEFFTLEKKLVRLLTEALEFVPTQEEADSIREIATRSLEAAIHFARGKELEFNAACYYGQKKYGVEDRENFLLQAVSEFKQSLYLDPEYADAQFELTMVPFKNALYALPHKQIVRYEDIIINECEEFVERFPDDSRCKDILMKLGYMYLYGKQPHSEYDKAIVCYKKSIFQYNCKDPEPVKDIVHAYCRKDDYGKAIEMCQFLIDRYPNGKKPGYYLMFNIYEECKQYDKALEVLKYIEKNELFRGSLDENKEWGNSFPHAHINDLLSFYKMKGNFYVRIDRIGKAVDEWEGMIDELRHLPKNKWHIWGYSEMFNLQLFWYDLAKAYRALGNEDKAIHYFQETTRAPTDDPREAIQSYYDLGKLYQKKREWRKALMAYEKLLALGNPRRESVDKDVEICRKNLGIEKPQTLRHWIPYHLFAEWPSEIVVNGVTKYIYERYGPAALVKYNRDLYFSLKYNRCARHKHKELGWRCPVTEKAKESGWYVCQASLSGRQKFIRKIPDIFKIKYITDIAVDDNDIWLASGNNGIIRFNRKNEKWIRYTTRDGLSHNTVWNIALTSECVYFGFGDEGRGGISEYDIGTGKWRVHWNKNIACAVTALAVQGDHLWTGVGDGTIAILDLQDKSWKIMRGKEGYGFMGFHPMVKSAETGASCSTIRDIHIQDSQVWFACDGHGVRMYDIKTEKWKEWKLEVKLADGTLHKTEACCLGIDRDTIWIGSQSGVGICALNIRTYQCKVANIDFWDVNSIVVDHNIIWFAGDGIMRFFKNGVKDEESQVSNK